MSIEVIIPYDIWEENIEEAVVTNWLVSDGAEVDKGTLLAEIMIEKAQYEIESPASGIIKIKKSEDEVVARGDSIAIIDG